MRGPHLPVKNVLLVEDDALIREGLALVLEAAGYAVRQAGDGQQGLRALRTQSLPDVILLDMVMPVMDGWTFLRVRQEEAPEVNDIPVIVFSAAYEVAPRAAEALNRFGVRRVLNKPTGGEETLAAVSQLFELIEQGA
jgi:CheY-like chemotaxis protein